MSNLPVFRLKPEDGDGPFKILHRNHLLPLGQKVCLSQVQNQDPVPKRKPRRRRNQQNDKSSVEIPEMSEQEDKDECTDSEGEELGVWYELPFSGQNAKSDNEPPEPFSLDLDFRSEVPAEVLQNIPGEQGANIEETRPDLVEHSDLQETTHTETEIHDTQTVDSEQTDLQTDSETRKSQRLRKAPSRLTYDTLGNPNLTVKYVSCLYKWISPRFIT